MLQSVVGLKGRCNEGVAELSEGDTPSVVLVYQAEAQLTLICFLDSLVNNSGHLRGDSIICCDDAKVREYGHDIGSSMLLITSSVSFSARAGLCCTGVADSLRSFAATAQRLAYLHKLDYLSSSMHQNGAPRIAHAAAIQEIILSHADERRCKRNFPRKLRG